MSAAAPTLSPTQERTLIDALFSPSFSLQDIAKALNLSLSGLLELIATPAIQDRLVDLEQSAAHLVRVAATAHLGPIMTTLSDLLKDSSRDIKALKESDDPDAPEVIRRERVNIRKAATVLLRFVRFAPLAPDALVVRRTASQSDQAATPTAPDPRPAPSPSSPSPVRPAPAYIRTTAAPSPSHVSQPVVTPTPAPAAKSNGSHPKPAVSTAAPKPSRAAHLAESPASGAFMSTVVAAATQLSTVPASPISTFNSPLSTLPDSPVASLLRRAGAPTGLARGP